MWPTCVYFPLCFSSADPELGGEGQIMLDQAKFRFDNQEILVACQ